MKLFFNSNSVHPTIHHNLLSRVVIRREPRRQQSRPIFALSVFFLLLTIMATTRWVGNEGFKDVLMAAELLPRHNQRLFRRLPALM